MRRYSCKDLDTVLILQMALAWQENDAVPWVWDQLQKTYPDVPIKVIESKLLRMAQQDLLEYGVSVKGAWPTEKGLMLLSASKEGP